MQSRIYEFYGRKKYQGVLNKVWWNYFQEENITIIFSKRLFPMKTLILVRHAKSNWTEINQKDIDRPLNSEGKMEAAEMALRLKEKGTSIDHFISSPAKRATDTCKIFCETLENNVQDIYTVENLYEGSTFNYEAAVNKIPNEYKRVAIFGHNPGISYFSHKLSDEVYIDNFPSCGVYAIEADCESWNDFMLAEKRVLFFEHP